MEPRLKTKHLKMGLSIKHVTSLFFFYVPLLCCFQSDSFSNFPLILPLLSSISIKFCFIATLLQHARTVTSRIAGVCAFIWGAIVKRTGMTAGGYIDLNIFSVKTCSCLFLWSVQQGHTVTKHIYFNRNYIFPYTEWIETIYFHTLSAKTCMISVSEVNHFKSYFYMYACNLTEC